MNLISVIVNTAAVILGSYLGLMLKKGIPSRFSQILLQGIGLCTIYIGIAGSLKGNNQLVLILSIVTGILIGEGINLDGKLNSLADLFAKKLEKAGDKQSIAQGFVTASLLFCVGSMSIVGSLQSGLLGNHEMIYAKSMLDFISSTVLSSSLGIGVLLSSVFVFLFQGGIVLLAQWVAPFLTEYVINEMISAGSIVIIAMGMNLAAGTKIKVINIMPATFIPLILCQFMK